MGRSRSRNRKGSTTESSSGGSSDIADTDAPGTTGDCGCMSYILMALSWLLVIITFPFSTIFCVKNAMQYERIVVLRLGRLVNHKPKGPGIVWILPCVDKCVKVDLRTVSLDVPPQEILTRDSVTVSVDAVVYYRVSNPVTAIINIEDAHSSTRLLAQTTLRNILGMRSLAEILCQRDQIVQSMQVILDEATDPWGIKVERIEMKDVRLPTSLQRAMAAEAEAAREAKAKVVAAEGERKAAKSLRDAAETIASQAGALQLRYLQALGAVSSEDNKTIVFPLPVDLIKIWVQSVKNELERTKLQSQILELQSERERLLTSRQLAQLHTQH